MAAIRFPCPACDKPIKAPPGQAGGRFQCPRCGADVTAPGEAEPPTAAPAKSNSLDDDFDSLFWDASGPGNAPPPASSGGSPTTGPPPPPRPTLTPRESAPPPTTSPSQPPPSSSEQAEPPAEPQPTAPRAAEPSPPPADPPNVASPSLNASEGVASALPPAAGEARDPAPSIPTPRQTLANAPGRVVNKRVDPRDTMHAAEPAQETAEEPPTEKRDRRRKKKKRTKAPEFRISCNVCGTRLDVSLRDVGGRTQCPDCHTMVLIEAPPEFRHQAEPKSKTSSGEEDDVLGLGPAHDVTVSNISDSLMDEIRESEPIVATSSTPLPSTTSPATSGDEKEANEEEGVEFVLGTQSLLDDEEDSLGRADKDDDDAGADAISDDLIEAATQPVVASPRYGFECSVCGTRMHATHEGESLTCPDCFSKIAAPPPPVRTQKALTDADRDAATAEEFQLSEAFDRPKYQPLVTRGGVSLEDIAGAGPSSEQPGNPPPTSSRPQRVDAFAYHCPSCRTSLMVTERQVGVEFTCPKCSTVSTIERPAENPPRATASSASPPTGNDRATHRSSPTPPSETPPSETPRSATPRTATPAVTANPTAGAPRLFDDEPPVSQPPVSQPPARSTPPTSPPTSPPTATSPPTTTARPSAGPAMIVGTEQARVDVDPLAKKQADDVLKTAEKEHAQRSEEDREYDLLEIGYLQCVLGFFIDAAAVLQFVAVGVGFTIQLAILMIAGWFLAQGGALAIFALVFGVVATFSGFGVGMLAAGSMRAILTDTANGAKRIESWPDISEIMEGFPIFVMMASAFLFSLAPGGAIGSLIVSLNLGLIAAMVFIVPSVFLIYPFVLLSLMENDSFIVPVSSEVLRGTMRLPMAWAQFYGESVVIILLTLATLACIGISYLAVPFVAFGLAALFFVYHRLLGRLSYRLAVAAVADEDDETNS